MNIAFTTNNQSGYELLPNEYVVLKEESVIYSENTPVFGSNELILTNINLRYITKKIFGKIDNIRTFPLNTIRFYNGQPQVSSQKESGTYYLKIAFSGKEEEFGFYDKKLTAKWVETIYKLAIDNAMHQNQAPVKEVYREVYVQPMQTNQQPVNVATNCDSCGAPLSGVAGQLVTCSYCGSKQVLTSKSEEDNTTHTVNRQGNSPDQKFCKFCGTKIHQDAVICVHCGRQVEQISERVSTQYAAHMQSQQFSPQSQFVQPTPMVNYPNPNTKGGGKNKWVALILCICLGFFGAHKFYENKIGMGVLYLFTGGLFGIGWFIDIIIILCRSNTYYT